MKVLEALLPKYFAGATQLLEQDPEILQINKNAFKPAVEPDIKSMLASNMTKEIEFYHIARQRLLRQYLVIS